MPRHPYGPLALWVGALLLPLCVRPVLADPEAGIVVPVSVHTDEVLPQRELVATAGVSPTGAVDVRDVEIELFEAALPPDIPVSAASVGKAEPSLTSAAEFEIPNFDVALFEAGLPRDIPAPAHDPAIPKPAAASPHEGKPPLKPAANHPRNKTPAAKQPLRSATARGKTNDAPGTSRPAPRSVAAAAPPATILHARPRAARADHGPRELFIARVPPSDRDEVMPAQRLIPVIRLPLPPPSLALK
jgi:pyruvate/2-oxoglutarate dehydrogenase complex dihydrolipoamide acyltransferase (E2) component